MPINSLHPILQAQLPLWALCRAAYEGGPAIKAGGTTFLPRLEGQKPKQYADYKDRAVVYEATSRTVEGMVGLVMAKPPVLTGLPERWKEWPKDITGTGVSLEAFAKEALRENLLCARGAIAVDMAEGPGLNPRLAFYQAEHGTNWGQGFLPNKEGLLEDSQFVVLKEITYMSSGNDPYTQTTREQYREIRLFPASGKCLVQVHQQMTLTGRLRTVEFKAVGEALEPTAQGTPPPSLPVVWMGLAGHNDVAQAKPPLLGMIQMNIAHYRNSADYENGLHICGVPTPYATGLDPNKNQILYLGSSNAWILPDPQSKAGFVEFAGQGLTPLKEAMTEKKEAMVELGAAVVMQKRNTVETGETARIHSAGETSLLMAIIAGTEQAIEGALRLALEWMGDSIPEDFAYKFNRDLVDRLIEAPMVTALISLWQTGGISQETLLERLKKGGVLADNLDVDAEKVKTDQEAATLLSKMPQPAIPTVIAGKKPATPPKTPAGNKKPATTPKENP